MGGASLGWTQSPLTDILSPGTSTSPVKKVRPLTLLEQYQDATKKLASVKEEVLIIQNKLKDLNDGLDDQKKTVENLRRELKDASGTQRGELRKKLTQEQDAFDTLLKTRKDLTVEEKQILATKRQVQKEVDEARERLGVGTWLYVQRYLFFVIFVCLVFVARFLGRRYVKRRVQDLSRAFYLRRTINTITVVIILLTILLLIFENIEGALTLIGFAAAGIAIALHDVFASVVGWAILVSGKGVRPGHRIQVGKVVGDVIEIGVFWTKLLEVGNWMDANAETGRGILLMNNFVFKEPVYNYHYGTNFIWQRIEIELTFESDWQKGLRLFQDVLDEHTQSFVVQANAELKRMRREKNMPYVEQKANIVFTIADSGYHYTLRYLTTPKQALYLTDLLSKKISEVVSANDDIEFAYPTRRIVASDSHRRIHLGGLPT